MLLLRRFKLLGLVNKLLVLPRQGKKVPDIVDKLLLLLLREDVKLLDRIITKLPVLLRQDKSRVARGLKQSREVDIVAWLEVS